MAGVRGWVACEGCLLRLTLRCVWARGEWMDLCRVCGKSTGVPLGSWSRREVCRGASHTLPPARLVLQMGVALVIVELNRKNKEDSAKKEKVREEACK